MNVTHECYSWVSILRLEMTMVWPQQFSKPCIETESCKLAATVLHVAMAKVLLFLATS